METSDWILVVVSFVTTLLGIFSAMRASEYRTQVVRLQAQRRMDRELGLFAPTVRGLWPDLDEKQRLRDRVAQLESERDGEVG